MTPGYRTSEFWVGLVLCHIIDIIIQSGAFGPQTAIMKAVVFLATAMASVGYMGARAHLKASCGPTTPTATVTEVGGGTKIVMEGPIEVTDPKETTTGLK